MNRTRASWNSKGTRQGLRVVASVVLVLALLSPLASGFVAGFEVRNSDCGMNCCRKAQHCSRHSHPGQSGWTASPSCPKGCGLGTGRVGSSVAGDPVRFSVYGPPARAAILQLCSLQQPARSGYEFALFARPPPSR
ncbi:MAG TPA: hypothetical protein VMH81_32455 [Bryobacteraceae bacterium]|nr:hypothetical protein [Bryobacteraceae bacterium]